MKHVRLKYASILIKKLLCHFELKWGVLEEGGVGGGREGG